MVMRSMFGNLALIMLFGLPLLTMRLYAEEKKTGTYELLFTLPLRDWETLLGKFLACWTVFGIFVSSLTENQIIAAFGTYGLILVLLAMGWSSSFVGPTVGEILKDLNIFNHLQSFLKGVLDTRDIVFYLLFSYLFMFLTLRSLETKRWRG